MNDQQAIARLKRGDMEALAALMERYQVQAVKTATLITRDYEQARDIVQAVFIRLYERSHLLDSKRVFGPYLMRSVVNEAVRASTRNQRFSTFEEEFRADTLFAEGQSKTSPEREVEASELQAQVMAALDELSPKQRAVIVMRYYLDMSEEEIATTSDVPRGTVKWQLHSARKRLRGILAWGATHNG